MRKIVYEYLIQSDSQQQLQNEHIKHEREQDGREEWKPIATAIILNMN